MATNDAVEVIHRHRHLAQVMAVQEQVAGCEACELRERCRRPVPFHVPEASELTVLGEAPGKVEEVRGQPFVGDAGQQMRRMLRRSGWDPEVTSWVNSVSCFPHGSPPEWSKRACRGNMLDQLAVTSGPIVMAGKVALEALIPDVDLGRVHGVTLRWRGRWVFPVWHPAFVLRAPGLGARVIAALGQLWRWRMDPWLLRGTECLLCRARAEVWGPEGLPYCILHRREVVERAKRLRNKERRERKRSNREAQMELGIGAV